VVELWTAQGPVRSANEGPLRGACSEEFLFACLESHEDADIGALARQAYGRIFDFVDGLGYPHLLRVWNYFPQITAEQNGMERYRRFNVGRHDAFVNAGRTVEEEVPAASALGTRGGPLLIYFLAARHPGLPLENPRQLSAYRYPRQYGPRSPSFARAMLARAQARPLLLLSGTASIVGHETVHDEDIAKQFEETLRNIAALQGQAGLNGCDCTHPERFLLKVYLRHAADQAAVGRQLLECMGPKLEVIWLQADICRTDLLVEIEGVCMPATGVSP
jgi:enamine deaminase RidA (YjgF/YER057c/UK114 family)